MLKHLKMVFLFKKTMRAKMERIRRVTPAIDQAITVFISIFTFWNVFMFWLKYNYCDEDDDDDDSCNCQVCQSLHLHGFHLNLGSGIWDTRVSQTTPWQSKGFPIQEFLRLLFILCFVHWLQMRADLFKCWHVSDSLIHKRGLVLDIFTYSKAENSFKWYHRQTWCIGIDIGIRYWC